MSSIETRRVPCRNGQYVTFRTPVPNDAAALIEYVSLVLSESPFFLLEPDEFAESEPVEREWIQSHLDSPGSLVIVAEWSERVVGLLNFDGGTRRRTSHEGSFGISVFAACRNQGIGSEMIQMLVDWAATNETIERLELEVFANNTGAIALYQRFGFEEEGRRRKAVKLNAREYADSLLMARFV